MATPSKLEILRAAGKVQRELAKEVLAEEVQVEVHAEQDQDPARHVTGRRRAPGPADVNPIEQIALAEDELVDVNAQLRSDQDLLRRLRGHAAPDTETEFEDHFTDAEDNAVPADAKDNTVPAGAAAASFSPDWLAKVIGAAVSAATSAATSPPSAASSRSTKLRITDRKLPDFWEWQPVAWFRLFDRHVIPFKPTSAEKFDALLPLLSASACKHVQPIVRSPGLDPYTKAKTSLIRHFDKTPRDRARECRSLDSLGDMMPTDMLEHIYGLQPDPKVIYEIIFLDLLPAAAKDAALQHSSLSAMAAAADKIVLEGSPTNSTPSVSQVSTSLASLAVDEVAAVGAPDRRQAAARGRDSRQPRALRFLCSSHARWGRNAHCCSDPSTCHMKDLVRPRQAPDAASPRTAQGNGRAGRQ